MPGFERLHGGHFKKLNFLLEGLSSGLNTYHSWALPYWATGAHPTGKMSAQAACRGPATKQLKKEKKNRQMPLWDILV